MFKYMKSSDSEKKNYHIFSMSTTDSFDNSSTEFTEDETIVKGFIQKCNNINEGNNGIGNNTDTILPDDMTQWKYYQISPEFNLLNNKVKYHLIHKKIHDEGRPLVILPGFSDKSVCWTIGRINKYLKTHHDYLSAFSDIYIFNYESVKEVQKILKDKDEYKENEFNHKVAIHTDKIIKSIKLKQVVFLARSAGGGIALRIAQIDRNQNNPDYIRQLNLCAPGYKESGLEDFLNARHNSKMESIPIKITWSKKDPTIDVEKGKQMYQQLKKVKYPNFIYEELDIDGEETAGVHHRIHPRAIELLIL